MAISRVTAQDATGAAGTTNATATYPSPPTAVSLRSMMLFPHIGEYPIMGVTFRWVAA